jgi:DNA-binding NarL/FixJ family response regulator
MRVVIAEDQVLLREGLGRLFEDGGHQVVAARGDARGLGATVAGHRPDLVVLDVRMPPTFTDEGARAAGEIKQAHPDTGVLLLSQHIETTHVVDLVGLSGFGYLLKDRVLAVANTGIAKRLYLSERTVEAHVRHVLLKLSIPDTEDGHRRVLAVLAHVSATTLRPSAPTSS